MSRCAVGYLLGTCRACYKQAVVEPDWGLLSDEQLLELKVRRLGLTLEGTPLQPLIQQFYAELSARGLAFHPPCHIGDEWFCPVGIPSIFVPFFLVHPRLRELERRMMLEVEGETPDWFMKLMRHEAGHAYSFAYRLYRRRKWQETFGLASTEESEFYRPRPYSRSYVVHLDDWYAQSHPDEDFAETFAVWLTPDLDWREKYRGWKALQKLEYVDGLMRLLAARPPLHQPVFTVAQYQTASTSNSKRITPQNGNNMRMSTRTSTTRICVACSRRRPTFPRSSKPRFICAAAAGPFSPRSVVGPMNVSTGSTVF